jgi:hypothetical protein
MLETADTAKALPTVLPNPPLLGDHLVLSGHRNFNLGHRTLGLLSQTAYASILQTFQAPV